MYEEQRGLAMPSYVTPKFWFGTILAKWKEPQYLALNHVLSPFHTQGVSQHGNIVDLHMGDVTGRVGESNKPMQCLFCNKKVY